MKFLFTYATLCLFSYSLIAQTSPEAALNSSDIERYIKSGTLMMKEFEALDDNFDKDDEDMSYEQVMNSYEAALKSSEAVEIIEKYGWDKDTFGQKVMAITFGTTYLMTLNSMKDMPEEQRKVMEEMFVKQYKLYVHADDLKVIEPRLDELVNLFKEY